MDALSLLPSSLTILDALALTLASLFTSYLTASIGIGGGTMLLAIMAQLVPIKALIPVHGIIQLGSNLSRAGLLRKDISILHAAYFLLGSMIGAIVGGNLVITLPVTILQIVLGTFILFSVWGPKVKTNASSLPLLCVNGGVSTLLTMFVGATGPFVLACLRPFTFSPTKLVATSAACMVIQHLLKVIVFGLLGFAFTDYALLMIAMLIAGFIGTFFGRKMLLKVDERKFNIMLNAVLSVLALKLCYSGLINIL